MIKTFEDLKSEEPKSATIEHFQKNLIKYNKRCKTEIKKCSPKFIKKIGNILMRYINNLRNLKNLEFLFIEPKISEAQLDKYSKTYSINQQLSSKTLEYFSNFLNQKRKVSCDEFIRKCSEYLYQNRKILKNEDVFLLLKFAISGHETFLLLAEIFDILGKEKILIRLENLKKIIKE